MLYSKTKGHIYLRLTPGPRNVLKKETAETNEDGTDDKGWGTKDERVRRNFNKNGSAAYGAWKPSGRSSCSDVELVSALVTVAVYARNERCCVASQCNCSIQAVR